MTGWQTDRTTYWVRLTLWLKSLTKSSKLKQNLLELNKRNQENYKSKTQTIQFWIFGTPPKKTKHKLKRLKLHINHFKTNLFFVQLKHLKSTFTFGRNLNIWTPPSYQKARILNFVLFFPLFEIFFNSEASPIDRVSAIKFTLRNLYFNLLSDEYIPKSLCPDITFEF